MKIDDIVNKEFIEGDGITITKDVRAGLMLGVKEGEKYWFKPLPDGRYQLYFYIPGEKKKAEMKEAANASEAPCSCCIGKK